LTQVELTLIERAKGKAVQMCMEDRLMKDTMLPEDSWIIKFLEELLYFVLEGEQFNIQGCWYVSIAGVVRFWHDKYMALDKWGMIDDKAEIGSFF